MNRVDWFHCDKCLHVFSLNESGEPRIESERYEQFGQVAVTTTIFTTCPCCGGEDLREHSKCEAEGCLNETLDGLDDCAACFEAADPDEFLDYMLKWNPEYLRKRERESVGAGR